MSVSPFEPGLVGSPPPGVTPQFSTNTLTQSPPTLPSERGRFEEGDPLGFMVYTGSEVTQNAPDTPRGFGSAESITRRKTEKTIFSLMRDLEKASKEEQRKMALALVIGGYGPAWDDLKDAKEEAASMSLGELLTSYTELLDEAAGKYAMGVPVTPKQVLAKAINYALPGGTEWDGSLEALETAVGGGGKGAKEEDLSGTFSSTSSSVVRDIMDPNDAMALTRGMLQRELGRDPTKVEMEEFVSTLQGAQLANPTRQKTTQTVTTDADGRVVDQTSNTTQREGIGAAGLGDVALRKARSNPNWAEWQAVGTYGPALIAALGSTVPGR